jgi:hypothetical protein
MGQSSPGQDYVHSTLLTVATAVTFAAGIPVAAGGPAPKARDTELMGFYIDLQAVTAVTLTIAGIDSGNWVINGQITLDTSGFFPWPLLNEAGSLIVTASVANLVRIFTRAYTGP